MRVTELQEALRYETLKQERCPFVEYDLHNNFKALEEAGQSADWAGRRWVWILRNAGTEFVEINVGADPVLVDGWIASDKRENYGYRYYMVSHLGCVPITKENASSLINERPILPAGVDPFSFLSRVPLPPFVALPTPSTEASWPQWRLHLRKCKHEQARQLIELIEHVTQQGSSSDPTNLGPRANQPNRPLGQRSTYGCAY